ncbi:hypothetical protein D3C80_124580 [compost metagenome]
MMKMTFKIGEIAKTNSYLFADVIEILVAINYFEKDTVSKNDIEDTIGRGVISAEELDDEELLEYEDGSSKHNRQEKYIDDAWFMLTHRSYVFGHSYPFIIEDEALKLCKKLSSSQYIYIFILFCSRLKSFTTKGIHQKWARYFTKLCKYATYGLAPKNAMIKIFDANSEDRRDYYTTNLKEALQILGNDMGVHVFQEHLERESTSGDFGIDIVAIFKFEDSLKTGNFVIFGQCGAQGENWHTKNFECHPDRFRQIFPTFTSIIPIIYTPADFRTADGEWFSQNKAIGGTVLDRRRIMKLLKNSHMISTVIRDESLQTFITEYKALIH